MENAQTTDIIYFSPTHSSEKIAKAIASGIGMPRRKIFDLTYDETECGIKISEDDLAIICVPVYAGRVAPTAATRLQRLKASGSKAIVAVTYGNRDYDDALVELYDIAVASGFNPIAAAAFIGEHSYSRPNMPIAEGRPDANDIASAKQFGKECLKKLHSAIKNDLHIKGNRPYRELKPSSADIPVSTAECAGCGECIDICPTHAISYAGNNTIITDSAKCIKCCACVKGCPIGARIFDTPFTSYLHQNFSKRREPEFFI